MSGRSAYARGALKDAFSTNHGATSFNRRFEGLEHRAEQGSGPMSQSSSSSNSSSYSLPARTSSSTSAAKTLSPGKFSPVAARYTRSEDGKHCSACNYLLQNPVKSLAVRNNFWMILGWTFVVLIVLGIIAIASYLIYKSTLKKKNSVRNPAAPSSGTSGASSGASGGTAVASASAAAEHPLPIPGLVREVEDSSMAIPGQADAPLPPASSLHFVLFYEPWCSHCKQTLPDFQSEAEKHGHKHFFSTCQLSLLSEDTVHELETGRGVSLRGVPCIVAFASDGSVDSLVGNRGSAALSSWVSESVKVAEEASPPRSPELYSRESLASQPLPAAPPAAPPALFGSSFGTCL